MSSSSFTLSPMSANALSRILTGLDAAKQSNVSSEIGMDASTFSKLINAKRTNGLSDLESFLLMLELLGLKIVDGNDVYCSQEIAEATRVYLRNAFNSPDYMRILFK